jgi:four helix bundle protein
MRCRNYVPRGFYEYRKADTGYRKDLIMTRSEFRKRTFQFGIRCIRLAEALPQRAVTQIIARQLIRAATSVGVNYRAAVRSRSRADFVSKMGIVEEECDEAVYWIEILLELGLVSEKRIKELLREADEILAVTISSIKTARKSKSV